MFVLNSEFRGCFDSMADGLRRHWRSLPREMANAAAIVQRINFTNALLSSMAAAVEFYELEPSEAAEQWLADNEPLGTSWISG